MRLLEADGSGRGSGGLCALTLCAALLLARNARAAPVVFQLQTRDPHTGRIVVSERELEPRRVAIVVVDWWNYHCCMTWSEQTAAVVPRLNYALAQARQLGFQVLWAPTDVANTYAGTPQRERARAVANLPLPKVRDYRCAFTVPYGACQCGPGLPCLVNYGHDAMHPDLVLAEDDLIVCGTQELYSICRERGFTQLLYLGGAVNICLTGKPEGLKPMYEAGLDGIVARDLVQAWTHYDPAKGYTPDVGTAQSVVDLERAGVPTVDLAETLRRLVGWDERVAGETVRLTPWGRTDRPYFFETSVTVSLNAPWLRSAAFHYTLDGAEPGPASALYQAPLVLTNTTTVTAAAFRNGQRVSRISNGFFVRLPPKPPKPDVYVDTLQEQPPQSPSKEFLFWPVRSQSFGRQPLRIRGKVYEHGLGMRAPANALYGLKPDYDRWVALAGIDDRMLDSHLGILIAHAPSVVFKVFIDGKLAAESPVLRISQEPWRFDVRIPAGSRVLNVVAANAGDRSPYDLANWVEAGFITREPQTAHDDR